MRKSLALLLGGLLAFALQKILSILKKKHQERLLSSRQHALKFKQQSKEKTQTQTPQTSSECDTGRRLVSPLDAKTYTSNPSSTSSTKTYTSNKNPQKSASKSDDAPVNSRDIVARTKTARANVGACHDTVAPCVHGYRESEATNS